MMKNAVCSPQKWILFLIFAFLSPVVASADTFGSGASQFEIQFATIGDAGNIGDASFSGNGALDYTFRLGKHEVSRQMVEFANSEAGLGITMDSMSGISGGPRDAMAATGVTWFESARFVNWLNVSSGYTPAYKFNGADMELWDSGDAGFDPNNAYRNSQAQFFLPSLDEWHKAAYFNPNSGTYSVYSNGTDTAPIAVASGTDPNTAVYLNSESQGPADIMLAGGLSPYGVMGLGANVWEWQETAFGTGQGSPTQFRFTRGGSWIDASLFLESNQYLATGPNFESDDRGFRIASRTSSVPEPGSTLVVALAALAILVPRRR